MYHSVDIVTLTSKIDAQMIQHESSIQNEQGIKKPKISREEIRVRVRGCDQQHIDVIDLPGMINTGEGMEDTRELIRRYIQGKQTLILLVSEAKQDEELIGTIDLAKEFDPCLARTLRVLTKFDTFDSPDAKAVAVDLINRQCSLTLGAHAVVCRSEGKGE